MYHSLENGKGYPRLRNLCCPCFLYDQVLIHTQILLPRSDLNDLSLPNFFSSQQMGLVLYFSDSLLVRFPGTQQGIPGYSINDTCLSHIRCHCAHLSAAKPFLSPWVFHAHLYLTPPPSLLLIYHLSRNQPLTTARELLSQCRKVVSESWCFFLGGNNGFLFVFREEQAKSAIPPHCDSKVPWRDC